MPRNKQANECTDPKWKAECDRVILDHLPLVKVIAIRIHESQPAQVELDDLIQAGILGLIDAVAKYNTEKNVAFRSYAQYRIRGAILDSLRQQDWATQDHRRGQKKSEAATRELSVELQRAPTESEVAAKMGIDLDRFREMISALQRGGLVSMSSREPGQEDLPEPDYPAKEETRPDKMSAHAELQDLLRGAMHRLSERYQKVVGLYYNKDMTMRAIGEILGINESRVSQIHKSALEKMAVTLHSAGIHAASAF
jgi:RNA polymerase sigma factor for flagellar operon FliA